MAYQSKSNRKFLATSLTAAMVASAVAPAASAASTFPDVKEGSFYYEYVSALAEAGIIDGRPDGSFDLGGKLNRAEAAKMISKIIKLDTTDAPASSFEDVKQDVWYTDYINALYAEGLIDGVSETEFAPNAELTRAQLAKMVVEAYGLELDASAEHPFTDVKEDVWYTDYIKTLYKHDLIDGVTGTTFEPNAPIKRADFAKLLTEADWAVGDTLAKPAAMVEGVSATNPTTLTVTGEGLQYLKAEDITVQGNKVESVTASADGKSATVKLANEIQPDKDYTVTVKKGEEKAEFTVNFKFAVNEVKVTTSVIDDDDAGQAIEFTVNGDVYTLDYLKNVAGYSVEFQSTEAAVNSTTGAIDEDQVAINDVFKVKVVLSKNGVTYESAEQVVNVVNKNATPKIGSILIADADSAVLNSKTLVGGEQYSVAGILSSSGDVVDISGGTPVYESSNEEVFAVDASGNILAVGPGKADLTVTAGNQVYTLKDLEVKQTARALSSITPSVIDLKMAPNAVKTVKVDVKDQYGDRFTITDTEGNIVEDTSSTLTVGEVTETAKKGEGLLTIDTTGVTASATAKKVYLKTTGGKILATINVTVTTENVVAPANSKFELRNDSESKDLNLDLNSTGDDTLALDIVEYTSANSYFGTIDPLVDAGPATSLTATGTNGETYTVEVSDSSVATLSSTGVAGEGFVVTAEGAGTTDIVFKVDGVQKHKVSVKVTDEDPEAKSFGFKSASTVVAENVTVSATRVLDLVTVTGKDSVLKNVTTNKDTTAFVRIDNADLSTGSLDVYLDLNDNGALDSGEDLGTVTATQVSNLSPVTDLSDLMGGTTAQGDKDSFVFQFKNNDGEVMASTTLKVDVK